MQGQDPLPAPGTTFEGRYEILATLGEGGFGTVHKARQINTGQSVALKLLRLPEPAGEARSEQRIARFLREMKLCAQLHHPNLVQLVDSGRTEGGLVYTVFAFAPGDNLADLLAKEGALDPGEARHLMLQVLDALACAHAEGVVHRDLKPRNIMVIPTGARRNALVLDFGIGAITEAEGREPTRLTLTNETLGTPGYAAPEQWRGLDPTPRADLFSWGLVMLECLTGKPVYHGGSAAEIVYQQLSPEPVPIPPSLDRHPLGEILRAVTRKDVAARDVTAAGLFAALQACHLRGLSRGVLHAGGEAAADVTTSTLAGDSIAHDGERRQVVAVCCKLSVQATSAEPIAPDAEDELLRAGLAFSARIARRHMGYAAATLGDEVLVYFGYPRAEEDDAPRAARAALAIVSAVAGEASLLAVKGARLEVRIGVHAGLVIASDAALAAGTTARLASRLSRVAPPGAVLVTADAHKLLRNSFELEAEGKPHIEGPGAPTKVFRLLATEGSTGPTPEGALTPIVGRDQEIDLLLDRWRRARAGGGQCGLITGEPGIGKSRLTRELRSRLANEAHTFIDGRCSPDARNNALYPVVELLGRALGLDQEPSPAGKVARLSAQIERHGLGAAEAMPLFLPLFSLPLGEPWAPLDVSPQKQKELTQSAILSLLLTMAEERPLLLLIEDLHWADPTTLELLGQLVREAPSAPLCLLLTARPEFSPAFPTTGMLQLQLNRLDRGQIEALAGELVGKKALPAAVLEQVANRTDGVPLFVEELVRMMIESGTLVEHAERYELAGALSDVEIPSTLRALLTARLDRLGRAKETAQLAAALGREFSVEVLSAVSTLGAEAVQEDLDRLMGAGLVVRKRRMKDPGAVFKHALVRDAAYESLSSEARRKTHARIAATLEEGFKAIVEARPDLLAHHHAAAEQKRVATGYAQKAAMGALMRSANAEAIGHARGALGWLDVIDDPRERAEVELGLNGALAPALLATRGWVDREILDTIARSQDLIDVVGDSPQAIPTLYTLSAYHHTRGERAQARVAGERAVALAVKRGDIAQEVAVLSQYANAITIDGSLSASRAACERTLSLYDPELHRSLAFTYGFDSRSYAEWTLAYVLWIMGYPDQAMTHVEKSVAWAREIGHANTTSLALFYVVMLSLELGDRERVLEVTAEILDMDKRFGLPAQAAYSGIARSWAARDVSTLKGVLTFMEGAGFGLGLSFYRCLIPELLAERGEHEEALHELESILKWARETEELYWVAENLRFQGACRFAISEADHEAAGALFREALDIARAQGAKLHELRTAASYAAMLQRLGRPSEAREILGPVVGWFTEGATWGELSEAKTLLRDLGG